jgi:hypothetical protein
VLVQRGVPLAADLLEAKKHDILAWSYAASLACPYPLHEWATVKAAFAHQ